MEKLETGKSVNSEISELQPRRKTTVKDVPYDCMELVMERLALVDHYRGWHCLMKPLSMRASPFNTQWFLERLEVLCSCVSYSKGVSREVKSRYCRLQFLDPFLNKKQEIFLDLEAKLSCGGSHETISRCTSISEIPWGRYKHDVLFAADKGLIVFNLHQNIISDASNRHAKFLVLNPINNSMSILPPIPITICDFREDNYSCCEAVPLKLIVSTGQTNGLKTTMSSSYKVYIIQQKLLSEFSDDTLGFRVIVYDSLTKLWKGTGVEWIQDSPCSKIFPKKDGVLYVSKGRFKDPLCYCDTFHDILYKYQDGVVIGTVKAPYQLGEKDRFCYAGLYIDIGTYYSCGCISTTVFEDEGKIFFFQQTTWDGSFGPSCISATIWELDDREMIWRQISVLHPHKLEFCSKGGHGFDLGNIMFTYEGILLVVHGHMSNADCFGVAGFNISKKIWCKVPEAILEYGLLKYIYLARLRGIFLGKSIGAAEDLDRFVFQPNATTRA